MREMLAALLLFLASTHAVASFPAGTFPDPELTCPIDGEKFVLHGSSGVGFSQGIMLDLQQCGGNQLGYMPTPICPTSKFVMYRTFSKQEIKRLRKFVKSAEFIKYAEAGDIDHQVVVTMRFLNEDGDKIAFQLLSSSWGRSEPSYSVYAKEALAAYNDILMNRPKDEKLWKTQQLVAGELERRLSLFADARRRFLALQASGKFDAAEHAETIRLELRLIDEENNATNSTNAECRQQYHIRFTLPMRACSKRKEPIDEAAMVADFCGCRPQYPKDSIQADEQGAVVIKFTVGPSARLLDEQIVESSGFKNLDRAAFNGLAKCQFRAASKSGMPIEGKFTKKFIWSFTDDPDTGDIQPDFEMQEQDNGNLH